MKTKIKLMAVADVHGDFDKLDISGVDVVIVAGDFGPGDTKRGFASDQWAHGAALRNWFAAHPGVRFYILPGNHDLFAKHHAGREKIDLLWPSNVVLIKDKGVVDSSGLTIWGMPWNPVHFRNGVPTSTKGGAFAADDPKIIAKCEKIVRRFGQLDILVTHAPPRIPHPDFDSSGWHFSPALASMLPRIRPRLVICGHMHDMSHRPLVINNGETTVVNVSLKLKHEDQQFAYKPRIIEIEVERALGIKMDEKSDMRAPSTAVGLSKADKDWLRKTSIRIEKTIRGVNKLIDEGKADETARRPTGKKFNKEVDCDRLIRLSPSDATGRVKKLVDVVKLLKTSESRGWTLKVLPELWRPNDWSEVYLREKKRKHGNVDFSAYRYE